MLPLPTRLITVTIIVAVISWIVGEIYGGASAWVAATICLGLLLFHQIWQSVRFAQLLHSPSYGEVPAAMGIWGEIYYRLHKLVRDWRSQVLEVEHQHNRFIQAIQASPNGVVMLNEDDQIEWCNSIAQDHFGLNAKRDAKQKISHLLRAPKFIQYINRREFGEPVRLWNMGEFENYTLEVQIFPYGDKQKLILSQDISQIEKADAMRRDFVANVSHELKTPLTVLAGFLETVQELDLTKEDRDRYLELMATQASRMKTLVEDLLILAKLEANPEPPLSQHIEVSNLFQRLSDDARALSQGDHEIIFRKSSAKNILGDEAEIYSAFINLISNAIRYTPPKGIVTVDWFDSPNGGAEFSVRDSGPGIPEQHLPRLSERFYRVDRSRSRETGGTGLGLAIVKHIIQRHHGELRISSEIGRGSCFTLYFTKQRLI